MGQLGSAAAIVLGAVFAWAGAAKLSARPRVAASFRALSLPFAGPLAVITPLLELAIAAALVLAPRAGAVAAVVALAVFTSILVRALRLGLDTGCGCFGAVTPDPISVADLVRNGLLAVGAAVAASTPRLVAPSVPAVLVAGGGALLGWVVLALLRVELRVHRGALLPERAAR